MRAGQEVVSIITKNSYETPGVSAGKQAMQIKPAKSLQLIGGESPIDFTEVALVRLK
ncbi:MAG: hypothetical protein QOE96_1447 [Blastocatellia bacterium]|nr:hypothetical protein [Blastocatellia bacterium]